MAEYTDRIDVAASADAVFAFVSDIENLPKYLPTVHHAHPQGNERVEVEGEANGHPYNSDGWFKVDQAARTMTWGSDGENDYSGKMKVTGDGSRAQVECSLQVHAAGGHQAVDGPEPGRPECRDDGRPDGLAAKHQADLRGHRRASSPARRSRGANGGALPRAHQRTGSSGHLCLKVTG